jgi:mycothiol synthase
MASSVVIQTLETTFGPYAIRNVRGEDFEQVSKMMAQFDPEPPSAEDLVHLWKNWAHRVPRTEVVAEAADGTIVGYGRSSRRDHNLEGAFFVSVNVDLAHRRRGIGSALARVIEMDALGRGATILTTFAREDDKGSCWFAEMFGYPKERDLFESVLDLTQVDFGRFKAYEYRAAANGIHLMSWEELGDSEEHRRMAHHVASISDTAPDMEIWGHASYEEFVKDHFEAPSFFSRGFLVAMREQEWIGLHSIARNPADAAVFSTDYTGTIPAARGLGSAFALKLAGLKLARAEGAAKVMTHNDSENRAMLSINAKLGFQRVPGWSQCRKRL